MKRRWIALAAVLAAAGIAAWVFAPRGGDAGSAPVVAPTRHAEPKAPTPNLPAPPDDSDETAAALAEGTIPPPEYFDFMRAPMPERAEGESDPEATAYMAALAAKMGWDKVKTLSCKTYFEVLVLSGTGQSLLILNGDLDAEKPTKLRHSYSFDFLGASASLYMICDDAFMEFGRTMPDGKRYPYGAAVSELAQYMPLCAGAVFDPSQYRYERLERVEVDPSKHNLLAADGSPLGAASLDRVTAVRGNQRVEMYVDPSSSLPVGMSVYEGEKLTVDVTRMKIEEPIEGVLLPTELVLNASEMFFGGSRMGRIGVRLSEVKINPELPADAFQFTAVPPKW